MQFHPVSSIFPMMNDTQLQELADDIGANGLIDAIWTYKGTIIDGRNRYRACQIVGEQPRYQEWSGDESGLVAFVVSLNLKRRHLDASQRAVIGLEIEKYEAERAKKRQGARNDLTSGKYFPEVEPERPRDIAAEAVNVNPRYIQDAKRIEREAPDLIPEIQAGKMNIPEAKRELERRQFYETTNAAQPVAVTMFSSESNEYYTPAQYIEAARSVMGSIDLDPASCLSAQETVKAAQFFTEQDDGISQEWHGRVWLNPPYGKIGNDSSQGIWAQYLISEYESGRVSEGIVLLRAAVGYEWFEQLWDILPVCFARERLSFVRADGSNDGQSKQGTAFFYVGKDPHKFVEVFKDFGRVILPGNQL